MFHNLSHLSRFIGDLSGHHVLRFGFLLLRPLRFQLFHFIVQHRFRLWRLCCCVDKPPSIFSFKNRFSLLHWQDIERLMRLKLILVGNGGCFVAEVIPMSVLNSGANFFLKSNWIFEMEYVRRLITIGVRLID